MNTYKIPVTWEVYGTVEVEASSKEEALKKFENEIEDFKLPQESYYVDGSFRPSNDNTTELLDSIEEV